MPRAANNSSTMRGPSGKWKYSQTPWPMISAGNRYPAWRVRARVVIPLTPMCQRKREGPPS
jgi:hypothetical protein